jgi:hypothetical protein
MATSTTPNLGLTHGWQQGEAGWGDSMNANLDLIDAAVFPNTAQTLAVNVKAYGAIGDGTTDDTAAIQAAITAALTAGNVVFIPAGTYKITSTLTVTEGHYFRMYGSGKSYLDWYGNDSSSTILKLVACYYSSFANFVVRTPDPSKHATIGIEILQELGHTYNSGSNTFTNVAIDGVDDRLVKCLVVSGTPQNNDFHMFSHCEFRNSTSVGVSFECGTTTNNVFNSCQFTTLTGQYAISNHLGSSGGNFSCYGSNFTGHTVADFRITFSIVPFLIEQCHSETSASLLETSDTGSFWPIQVEFRGCKFNAVSNLLASNRVVTIGQPGSYVFNSCYIDGGDADPAPAMTFYVNNVYPDHFGLTMTGCYIHSSAAQIFEGAYAPTVIDSYQNTTSFFSLTRTRLGSNLVTY